MDKTDMQILSCLVSNCRESNRRIGEMVGISGTAVGARIKKMALTQVIRGYTLKIEPPALGFGVFYAAIAGGDAAEKTRRIGLVGDLFFVIPCVGGVTVCSVVVRGDVGKAIELAKNLVRDVRILSYFDAVSGLRHSGLTRTDLEIIGVLLDRPREGIEAISSRTGMSAKTVTRSIAKMHNDDSMQFTTLYDPTMLANYIPYAILVWIRGDMGRARASFDARFAGRYMQPPFVANHQVVLFMYSDNIFKMDAVTEEIRGMSGVQAAEIFIPRDITFPHEWLKNAIDAAKKSPTLHLTYPV